MANISRAEVENFIDTKIDIGGQSTAIEVREVLRKILDYTENEEQGESNLKPFHFFIDQPIQAIDKPVALLYSFKGIIGETVNFTFSLFVSDNSGGSLSFILEPNLIEVLKEIIQTPKISFVIPIIRTDPTGRVETAERTMSITIKEPTLIMEFANGLKLDPQDSVFTSIHLHAPPEFQIR